ncbi:MAG: mechanosensitive ion channel [Planctomycetes bacterium]|nr:mechanosensitive ion channel [Planctomycetota bacterium]
MRISPLVVLGLALLSAPPAAIAQEELPPPSLLGDIWEARTLDPAALEARLGETREALNTIPDAEKDDSPAGKRRSYLRRRAALLEELLGVLKRRNALGDERRALPSAADLTREIEALAAAPPPAAPAAPTIQGAEEKLERLKAAQKAVEEAERESGRLAARLKDAPALAAEMRKREEEAEARHKSLEKELAATPEEGDRAVLQERRRNARLDARVARESLAWLEEEGALLKESALVAAQRLDLLQRRQKRLAEEYRLYQEALGRQLEEERKQKDEALARQQAAAAAAEAPSERLLAARETAILQRDKELAELERRKLALQETAEKHRRLHDAERRELERLKNIVERTGSSELAAARLKDAFSRLGQRSALLRRTLDRNLAREILALSSRQIEIGEELAALEERQAEEAEEADRIAAGLPAEARTAFRRALTEKYSRHEKLLNSLRTALDEVIAEAQTLETIQLDRLRTLEEEQVFIQARTLWIRDAPPLDLALVAAALKEAEAIGAWARETFSSAWIRREAEKTSALRLLVRAIALVVVFPGILVFVRRRIRRLADRKPEGAAGKPRPVLATAGALAGAVLLPAYVYGAAWLVAGLELEGSLHTVLGRMLGMIAVLMLIAGVRRVLVGRDGLATALYGLHDDTARTIHRAVRLLVFAAFSFLVPCVLLLQDPPFGHTSLARIAYTLFEASAIVALVLLMRPGSPLVRDTVGEPSRANPIARFWGTLSKLAIALFLAILVMDVLGYRFGAARLTRSVLLSLGTIIVLMALYRLLVPVVEDILRRRRRELTAAPGETPAASVYALGAQARRFTRAVFFLVGVVLLVLYWGIDEKALKGLDGIVLHTLSSVGDRAPDVITVADVLVCMAVLLLTVWILHYLPSLYEIVVFPRVHWDSGLRYAVLTISRYGIVFVGVLIALSAIQLDLGRLGWLMAALGVGIGFGLQEIVSNFVCGVILLVERPIRVGDTITVGALSGEVTRINIRATTVLNWDRMEVIIPNKDLITKEVTNWTLADNITRVTVPIGVEYGSDVDAVRKMLLELADRQPEILKDPRPTALFLRHGESSLDFEVRFFVSRLKHRLELIDRMNTLINKRLGEMGIGIPFPQRDLHLRSDFRAPAPTAGQAAPQAAADGAASAAPPDRRGGGPAPADR